MIAAAEGLIRDWEPQSQHITLESTDEN